MIRQPETKRADAGRRGGVLLVTVTLLAVVLARPDSLTERLYAAGGAAHPDLSEFGDIACTDCHDDRLEGKVVHPPAEECDTCHEMAGSGEEATVSLTAPVEELCLMCHDNPASAGGAVSRHMPVSEAMCTTCHDPHSTDRQHLLGQENVCFECHDDIEEELQRPYVHGAVTDLGCPACHDPHASSFATLLRAQGNDLCLACHGTSGGLAEGEGGEEQHEGPAILFGSRPLDAARLAAIPKIRLGAQHRGHPVGKHPVQAESNPLRPDGPFGCSSCHPPHAANRKGLLVGAETGGLCLQCHRK